MLWALVDVSIDEAVRLYISLLNAPELCGFDWTAVDESIVEVRKVERDIRRCKDISMLSVNDGILLFHHLVLSYRCRSTILINVKYKIIGASDSVLEIPMRFYTKTNFSLHSFVSWEMSI